MVATASTTWNSLRFIPRPPLRLRKREPTHPGVRTTMRTLWSSASECSPSGSRALPNPTPSRRGKDVIGDHAVLVPVDRGEHRLDQRFGEQVRLQAQIEKLRVHRVVVVLLHLDARV